MYSPIDPVSTIESSKAELQNILKDRYRINKNISQDLTTAECRQLINILSTESQGLEKLLTAFAEKNSNLGRNNANLGRQRSIAQKRVERLQVEFQELQQTIEQIESNKLLLESRKCQLEQESAQLERQIESLQTQTKQLDLKVTALDANNHQLTQVNHELKQDNKRLKNLVDAIRLNLSKNIKGILGKEDGEIRKALAKMYKSIIG